MLQQEDIQLLQALSQTSDMGAESMKQVMDKTDDPVFKQVLQRQLKEHSDIYTKVQKMVHYENVKAKQANPISKLHSQVMSSIKTITAENTISKIAEMVIQGNTVGNTELTKKIHEYQGNNIELRDLIKQYIDIQQKNIDEMKAYL